MSVNHRWYAYKNVTIDRLWISLKWINNQGHDMAYHCRFNRMVRMVREIEYLARKMEKQEKIEEELNILQENWGAPIRSYDIKLKVTEKIKGIPENYGEYSTNPEAS